MIVNDIELEVDCYLLEMRKFVKLENLDDFDAMADIIRGDYKKLVSRLERSEYLRFNSKGV